MARGRMPGNMGNMMKQVKKMQKDMEKMQKELEEKEYTATAGGGAIEVTVNGKNEVLDINLDEAIVDRDEIEMLEDLVIASINSAMEKAKEDSQKSMGKLTGGMNIPGL